SLRPTANHPPACQGADRGRDAKRCGGQGGEGGEGEDKPREAGTRYQQQGYEGRLAEVDRGWQGDRRPFFVGGRPPSWLGVILAALVGGGGLAFLAWSVRILVVEGTLWPTPLLLGGAMAVTGGTAAVLTLVQLLRCRAAERRYLGRRA